MYILIFLLILIKSELMVVIIVYIVYKILVWNVEYKKIIFIDNKKWICCLRSYVLLVMFILLINVLNYIN